MAGALQLECGTALMIFGLVDRARTAAIAGSHNAAQVRGYGMMQWFTRRSLETFLIVFATLCVFGVASAFVTGPSWATIVMAICLGASMATIGAARVRQPMCEHHRRKAEHYRQEVEHLMQIIDSNFLRELAAEVSRVQRGGAPPA